MKLIIFIISGFGIYGAAVVPDSGVGNTWQRLTLVLHELLALRSFFHFRYRYMESHFTAFFQVTWVSWYQYSQLFWIFMMHPRSTGDPVTPY